MANLYRRGDSGPVVTDIQRALNAAGSYGIDEDGQFGPVTEDAVKSFQTSKGLVVDGIVGPLTAGALGVDLSPLEPKVEFTPVPPAPSKTTPPPKKAAPVPKKGIERYVPPATGQNIGIAIVGVLFLGLGLWGLSRMRKR